MRFPLNDLQCLGVLTGRSRSGSIVNTVGPENEKDDYIEHLVFTSNLDKP